MLRVKGGADDLERLAKALDQAADSDLKKQVYKTLRTEAKPLGKSVVRTGVETFPAGGGLRARIEKYRTGISPQLSGSTARITLRLSRLRGYDSGRLRHPVYGGKTWVRQAVPAGTFTAAFTEHASKVRPALVKAVQQTLDDVARKV